MQVRYIIDHMIASEKGDGKLIVMVDLEGTSTFSMLAAEKVLSYHQKAKH
jgi:hypothetical protein